jgi:hypothetical protein
MALKKRVKSKSAARKPKARTRAAAPERKAKRKRTARKVHSVKRRTRKPSRPEPKQEFHILHTAPAPRAELNPPPPLFDLLTEVRSRLDDHNGLDSTMVDAEVNGNVVTLTGSVTEQREKTLAERLVRGVFGVRRVKNEIRVQAQTQRRRAA